MHFLTHDSTFPEVSKANEEGLLAIGGDLSTDRLLLAYRNGIFPWFSDGEPILWWSPDPRFVLFPEKLKVSKSMKQILRKQQFTITTNTAFREVVMQCALIERGGQAGTWITREMMVAYSKLHDLGYAKSVEVWEGTDLVGGLYGIDLGNKVFCGESMFAKKSNASKVGLITFIQRSDYQLIDCQIFTDHLSSLGAEEIPRKEFISLLGG